MQYRKFIEQKFLIDDPVIGKLVPFKFRKVQNKYYDQLVEEYDIENKGISSPVREIILKARRQGFSSFVLALFAADDLLQDNPTESLVISYKDDATDTFRKRYRLFVTSYLAQELGYTQEQICNEPAILDIAAKEGLSIDSNDIELKHNKAHFYCGTASARVGGRGGVLQKLLFSEAAFYPDSDKVKASEIIDGTMRQVDPSSGFVFMESTANGYGNAYQRMESTAAKGEGRFKSRFFSWMDFYTPEEFEIIKSEMTDKAMIPQEYPATREEAYIHSGTGFFDSERIGTLLPKVVPWKFRGDMAVTCQHEIPCRVLTECSNKTFEFAEVGNGEMYVWEKPVPFHSYTIGADVAEGVDGDASVCRVIDNRTLKTVAKFKSKLCPPDQFAIVVYGIGAWYNFAYTGVESNKDGLWVNTELFKMGYPNLYYREQIDDITRQVSRKLGFHTGPKERPVILAEFRKMLAVEDYDECWNDIDLLRECLVFIRNKMGRAEAMSGEHDDEVMSHAIALAIRQNAPEAFDEPKDIPQNSQSYVMQRLEKLRKGNKSGIPTQSDYLN